MKLHVVPIAAIASLALALAREASATPAATAATAVASKPASTSASGAGNSFAPRFSADGRAIAFVSAANNLVTNDDLGPRLDVFVRLLPTSNTVLVSANTNGLGGGNRDSILPSLSSNGLVCAFESMAGDLAPGDANGASDVFVRQLPAGPTRLVSVSAGGGPSGNGPSFGALISADGRFVVFESAASNLVTNDFNGTNDIFLHDLITGVTTLASVNAEGTASAEGPSITPAFSEDGRYVAFASQATNLVAGVTNQLGEIYLRDVLAGTTAWAGSGGAPPPDSVANTRPAVSRDGRYIGFIAGGRRVARFDAQSLDPTDRLRRYSIAPDHLIIDASLSISDDGRFAVVSVLQTNPALASTRTILRTDFETLVTNVVNGGGTVPVTNTTWSTEIVSTNLIVAPGSPPGQTYQAIAPALSADGQRVVFLASLPNPNVLPPSALYVRDMGTNVSFLVVSNFAGPSGYDLSDIQPALAPDGSQIAWESYNAELVASDSNGSCDVFTRPLSGGVAQLVSVRHPSRPATTGPMRSRLNAGSFSADGRLLGFTSLTPSDRTDTNHALDAYLHDTVAGTNSLLSGGFRGSGIPGVFSTGDDTNVFDALLSADGLQALFTQGLAGSGTSGTNLLRRGTTVTNNGDMVNFGITSAFAPNVENVVISGDGRQVAYQTFSPITGFIQPSVTDNNFVSDIVLRDYRPLNPRSQMENPNPINWLVSVNSNGTAIGTGPSIRPQFSPDGRWLAFQSRATNLTAETTGGANFQIYVRGGPATNTPKTKLVSYAPHPVTGRAIPLPSGGTNAAFSGDSRWVAFVTGTNREIHLHDLVTDPVLTVTTLTVSNFPGGAQTIRQTNAARTTNLVACADCTTPALNADGRLVAYLSPAGPEAPSQVWLKDVVTGSNELISVALNGTNGGNGACGAPLFSYDARYVVFASLASNLTPGDNNRASDIFLRDRLLGVTHCLSRNYASLGTGNGLSSNPVLSADGRTIAFQSFASDLVPGDYNDTRDVFVVRLAGPDTDGDTMDDDWELAYFGTLMNYGLGDSDGDRVIDRGEFLAGTDPTNQGDVLRVIAIESPRFVPQSSTTLIWAAVPGRKYRVQFKDELHNQVFWQDVPGDVIATGSSASKVHLTFDDHPRRFYRVTVVP